MTVSTPATTWTTSSTSALTGSTAEQTISQEKYVSVTTFRKAGAAVATAIWIVPLDGGRVGFLTSSASGKAKRLRNNSRVTLQPCDVRDRVKPGTTPVTGTVELVTSGPDFETITSKVKVKYGLMVPIIRLVDRVRHLGRGPFPLADTGVVITLLG
jgi:PPOX class probable F420-dependent enzyme